MSDAAASPYAAPASNVDDVPANPEAEAIRRAHINHETSIKVAGLLYYLSGAVITLGGLAGLAAALGDPVRTFATLLIAALGALQVFVGWGLRSFKPWARIVTAILSVLGLLAFPVGTVISGYILYLLVSKKGGAIFKPEYKDLVAATPHVKYHISILVWIFIVLFVGFIVFGAFRSFLGE